MSNTEQIQHIFATGLTFSWTAMGVWIFIAGIIGLAGWLDGEWDATPGRLSIATLLLMPFILVGLILMTVAYSNMGF